MPNMIINQRINSISSFQMQLSNATQCLLSSACLGIFQREHRKVAEYWLRSKVAGGANKPPCVLMG